MAASRAQVNLNKAPALPAAQNFAELQAQILAPAQLASQVSALRDKISNSSNRTKTAQFKTQLRDLTYSQEVLKRQVAGVGAYTQKLNNVKAAESAYNRNPNPNTGKIYNDALSMALVVPDMPDKRGVKKANPAAQSLDIAAQEMGFDTAAASEKVNQMVAKGHVTREAADSWGKVLTGALTAGSVVAAAAVAIANGGTALLGAMAPTTGGATAAGGAGALGGTSSVAAANPLMAANAASQAGVGSALTSGGNLMAANAAGQVGMGSALANAGITAAGAAINPTLDAMNVVDLGGTSPVGSTNAAGLGTPSPTAPLGTTPPPGLSAIGSAASKASSIFGGISNADLLKAGVSAASIGAGALSASQSAKAASRASDASVAATDRATQTQWDMYKQSRADQMPWLEAGKKSLADLSTQIEAGPGDFTKSPGYEFRLKEGEKAILRNKAATGGVASGATLKALESYAQGTASNEYDRFLSRYYDRLKPLQSMAGVGQTTATNVGGQAQQTGANVGNLQTQAGQAQAGGYIDRANAWTGALQGSANALGTIWGNR